MSLPDYVWRDESGYGARDQSGAYWYDRSIVNPDPIVLDVLVRVLPTLTISVATLDTVFAAVALRPTLTITVSLSPMSTKNYPGDSIWVTATFTDTLTEDLYDADDVTLTVRDPGGTSTIYTYGIDAELTRVSTGVYRFPILLTAAGNTTWSWQASSDTNVRAGVEQGTIQALPSKV